MGCRAPEPRRSIAPAHDRKGHLYGIAKRRLFGIQIQKNQKPPQTPGVATRNMALAALFLAPSAAALASYPVTKSVEIAPGVQMPTVNLGGVSVRPSNYSLFLELGGTGLDTALSYGDETQAAVGEAVKSSKIPRENVFVTTKVPCCPYGGKNPLCKDGARNVYEDIEHDLQTLGLEYVDLMLVHWPCGDVADTFTTYQAIAPMVERKTARAVGVSNFNSSDLALLQQYAGALRLPQPAVNQCSMRIGDHDDETIEYCLKNNITYEAYSPLGGGGGSVLDDPDVKAVAKSHGVTPAQVALRWVAQAGAIIVTAADQPEYIKEDLDIFSFELTDQEFEKLAKK